MNVHKEVFIPCPQHEAVKYDCHLCLVLIVERLCTIVQENEKKHQEELQKLDRRIREARQTAYAALDRTGITHSA